MIDNCIGIDPGTTGAIVVIMGGSPVEWLHMPTVKIGASNRVNVPEVAAFLRDFYGLPAYLELVGTMPKQGVSSVFTFGHAAGMIQGTVQALGHPLTMVTPQKWKRAAGLIGEDKDAARSRASMLWPDWRALDKKIKGQALADAALIARFGA